MSRPVPRRRPPALALLAALAPLALSVPSALAGDGPGVSRTNESGWPRSSDTLPPAIEREELDGTAPHGTANPSGTSYDTNWFFDAESGDENVVWFHVSGACIQGYGHATEDSTKDVTRRTGSAWGEERVTFTVDAAPEQPVVIVVRNPLRLSASWIVEGSGRNHAHMRAEVLDVTGAVHVWGKQVATSPSYSATTGDEEAATSTQQDGGAVGSGDNGRWFSLSDQDTQSNRETHETRVESCATLASSVGYSTTAEARRNARSCRERIASSETIEVKAQSVFEDVPTLAEVPHLDIVNVIEASYAIDDGGTGPGTPGGEDPEGGATTPGGDGTDPAGGDGGTTPKSDDGGTAPLPTGTEPFPGGTEPAGTEPGGTEPAGTEPGGIEPMPTAPALQDDGGDAGDAPTLSGDAPAGIAASVAPDPAAADTSL